MLKYKGSILCKQHKIYIYIYITSINSEVCEETSVSVATVNYVTKS